MLMHLRTVSSLGCDGSAPGLAQAFARVGLKGVQLRRPSRRAELVDSTGTTRYAWDGIRVLKLEDEDGSLKQRQVHGYAPIPSVGDIALMESADGNPYVPDADQVGTVVKVLGSAGAVANAYQYDAFGVSRAVSESFSNPFRFAGKPLDGDVGLYHWLMRQYSPSDGRFCARDRFGAEPEPPRGRGPFLDVLTVNAPAIDCACCPGHCQAVRALLQALSGMDVPYAYVLARPLRLVDPRGQRAYDTDPSLATRRWDVGIYDRTELHYREALMSMASAHEISYGVTNVEEMAAKLSGLVGECDCVGDLHIFDHATPTAGPAAREWEQDLGTDVRLKSLKSICGSLCDDAMVVLYGCKVGGYEEYLRQLKQTCPKPNVFIKACSGGVQWIRSWLGLVYPKCLGSWVLVR